MSKSPSQRASAPKQVLLAQLHLIPEQRRDSVADALTGVGLRKLAGMTPISGGVSGAHIYRLRTDRRNVLLRLEPERVAREDRERGIAGMAAAAESGVAPRVHHADPITGITLTDFIESRPLSDHPDGPKGISRALGRLVARLQTAAPFPSLGADGDVIAWQLDNLARSPLFRPSTLDPHREGLARIRAARPWQPSSHVASHNDPNPRNLLFDGERLWLVDWELAFRHDPLFDLAILSTEIAAGPELETALLEGAFGRAPDESLLAQLHLVRLLSRLFYGCVVLENFANQPRTEPDTIADALTQVGFHSALREGHLGSGTQETAYAFGKMSLREFLDGLSSPQFAPALAAAVRAP